MEISVYKMKTLFLTLVFLLLSACAAIGDKPDNTKSLTFFIHANPNLNVSQNYSNADNSWGIQSVLKEKIAKPKTFYYDISVRSDKLNFSIADINYKYGDFGKWRKIQKSKYLSAEHKQVKSNHTISRFPITIKKTGDAHIQTLRISVANNKSDQKQEIDLVFGVEKCIAKKENEMVCF